MQFEWIDFYSEFATKLLSFKNDRKLLIKKINNAYKAIDMKVPKLESGDEIIDIDPFTVFGLFNKGITNDNRIAIIKSIAKEFAIEAKTPDVFDGIPLLNNLKATFYGFKEDRKENDIDNLCADCMKNLYSSISEKNIRRLLQMHHKYLGNLTMILVPCYLSCKRILC